MQNHPRIVSLGKRIYAVLSWSLLLLAILSWMFVPETRKGLFQLLLCLYALWQFWILSRSKTLSWAEFIRVFTVGAWVIGPLTAGVVWGTHVLLDERPGGTIRDEWSTVYFGPFVEEVCKLIPLGFLCLFSRRSRSYGICDYMLIGAASGTGFEFIEEMVRRWTADVHLSIDTLINRAFGDEYEWRWDVLFPGAYEHGNQFAPGHHIWTGFIALGIGFAVSLQAKWGRKAYVIPLFLFCWALFDHSSFNDQDLHWIIGFIYDLLGNGHFYRYLFIVCIVLAVCRDYWLLNKQRMKLPLLHRELVIDPISELLLLLQSLWKGAGAFFHTLAFLRERRQLGYALCSVVDEKHVNDLTKWIVPRFSFLASIFVCVAIVLIGTEQVSLFMGIGEQAYFAGLLKDLSAWWNDLSTLEKGALIVTTVVLGGLLTVLTGGGFLAGSIGALGAALTMKDILDNPDPLVTFIENPKATFAEWKKQFFHLTPSEATGLAAVITISFLLDRLPAKRIMDLLLDNLREGVQHLTRKLFPPVLQVEMGGGKWNIPVKWMPGNYWQSSSYGGSGGKVSDVAGNGNSIGSIVKDGNNTKYTNPAGNELKWVDQHPKNINRDIENSLNSNDPGKATEAKVASAVRENKDVIGFGQKIQRADNSPAGDLDVVTKDEIIEVKKSLKAVTDVGQFDKYVDVNHADYFNPDQKKVILYIEKPLANLHPNDQIKLEVIKSKGIVIVNSIDELMEVLK